MADLPIPFTASMVRGLLREIEQPGTGKTQTRRLPDQPPAECSINFMLGNESWLPAEERSPIRRTFEAWHGDLFRKKPEKALCGHFDIVPRYQIGDRLYVREAWRAEARYDWTKPRELRQGVPIYYEAGGGGEEAIPECAGKLRPGMFMPKWTSRLTLIVEDVRVERLQHISDADAIAEGAIISSMTGFDGGVLVEGGSPHIYCAPRTWYRELWDTINGAGAWDANPWIVAYTFRLILGNIDTLAVGA